MARFDIHRASSTTGLLVDVQADLHRHLATRVVVPLRPTREGRRAIGRMEPIYTLDGTEYLLATSLLTAVAVRELGPPIGSLAEHEYEIGKALDLLLTGV